MIGFLESNKEIIETICSIIGVVGTISTKILWGFFWKKLDKKHKQRYNTIKY